MTKVESRIFGSDEGVECEKSPNGKHFWTNPPWPLAPECEYCGEVG